MRSRETWQTRQGAHSTVFMSTTRCSLADVSCSLWAQPFNTHLLTEARRLFIYVSPSITTHLRGRLTSQQVNNQTGSFRHWGVSFSQRESFMRHLPCSAMCALNHTGRMYGRARAAAIDWTTISLSQRSSSGHRRCNIFNLVRVQTVLIFDSFGLDVTVRYCTVFVFVLLLCVCLYHKHTFCARGWEWRGAGSQNTTVPLWKDEVIQGSDFKMEVPQKIRYTSLHSWR